MELPTINIASVKVMRSHDYCHFEVCLSTDTATTTEQVDALRKEAARLADKAVEQYKMAKAWASVTMYSNKGDALKRLRDLAAVIHDTPENERTPEEKAILKAIADDNYAARTYDYQDDWKYPDED